MLSNREILTDVRYLYANKYPIKGPQSATPLFLFTCANLAIIFYLEPVETKENHCKTNQDN